MSLEGRSLINTLLDKEDLQLTEETTIKILYRLLCSLKYLHQAGVMHRDIKPGNILLDSGLNVKICDFGLSRTIVSDPAE